MDFKETIDEGIKELGVDKDIVEGIINLIKEAVNKISKGECDKIKILDYYTLYPKSMTEFKKLPYKLFIYKQKDGGFYFEALTLVNERDNIHLKDGFYFKGIDSLDYMRGKLGEFLKDYFKMLNDLQYHIIKYDE